MLVIQRIDLGQLDEPGDVHAAAGVAGDIFQFLIGNGHKLSLADLVSSDDILPLDDALVVWAVTLVLDGGQALFVQKPESHILLIGRGVELDRKRDQPKADMPPPVRSHRDPSVAPTPLIAAPSIVIPAKESRK